MAQWGNTDDAANSVLWATAQVNLPANTDNQSTLFDNTTVNVFKNNDVAMPIAVGQFGVDTTEAQALREGAGTKVTHAGWVLRTAGTGGRSGRVTNEVLVAMGSMSTDASDDTTMPDYKVRVTTNPANNQNSPGGTNDVLLMNVAGATKPVGGTISYLWYYSTNGGTTYNTTVGQAAFSGQTTANLQVLANTVSNGTLVKAVLSSGGTTANSTAATITIVP